MHTFRPQAFLRYTKNVSIIRYYVSCTAIEDDLVMFWCTLVMMWGTINVPLSPIERVCVAHLITYVSSIYPPERGPEISAFCQPTSEAEAIIMKTTKGGFRSGGGGLGPGRAVLLHQASLVIYEANVMIGYHA